MSSITVENNYRWMLDPRYGRMCVYVDGSKVGAADLAASLTIDVNAHEFHTVRVRLWWFRSPLLRLSFGDDENRRLYANVRKDLSLSRGLARMMFKPMTSLYLGEDPL